MLKKHSRSFGLTSSLLPDREEGRQAQAGGAGLLAEHDPDRAGLRDQGQPPGQRIERAKVAFIRTSGSVLITPRQFGPTIRIPCLRATLSICGLDRGAGAPRLAEAAVMIVTARTPIEAASSITPGTADAGTATTARSTGSGIDNSAGNAGTPQTARAEG